MTAQAPPNEQILKDWLDGIDRFLKSVESVVAHLIVGSRLDKAGNLEVDTAALFARDSSFAQAGAMAKPLLGEPLAGLPDVPFLFAFSGSMSGEVGQPFFFRAKAMEVAGIEIETMCPNAAGFLATVAG